jgi:hypothetical protein
LLKNSRSPLCARLPPLPSTATFSTRKPYQKKGPTCILYLPTRKQEQWEEQGCGSGSELDPEQQETHISIKGLYCTCLRENKSSGNSRVVDQNWILIQSGQWIRIRIQEGKNDPQK